ncbi:MAG TPA: carboxypeptidase-like regulatory domain-containing protein [Pyrinomonadaceae bacterium]|nr:carboxypeptidase regulatory-like domain-containing protein [Acidobacteriota bacterium]HQZ96610.1 carboxypeptidase-like regulatory domain-containing protein [Pyrinomonadaceae bacterium]
MGKNIFLLILIMLSTGRISLAQRQSSLILPQTTDPGITTNLNNHFVSINRSVTQKNQLFIFLPGTGGVGITAREINWTAADLGFHAINLTYPNDEAINDLCSATADLDCYANARLEVLDGTNRSSLVNVSRPNSIENRLIKLLIYLRTQSPNDNWGQFLINDSTIDWSKIVITGHSQGGGHAAIIGRYHAVARVVMFAAMDFNARSNAPANWIAQPNTTPNATTPDRFWGFSHTRDDQVNFTLLTNRIWPAYGMPTFGAVSNVDTQGPPFSNTHSLTTDLDCDVTHGCIVVDARLSRLPDGTPIYKPVWEYLLSNTVASSASISGRVLSPSGIAIRNVIVTLTDSQGIRRTAVTGSFGTFTFEDVLAGQTVIIGASSKRYRFAPISISLTANLLNVDLIGLE